MLKACKYCGRIHDSRFDCGHKPHRTAQHTQQSAIRNTYRWQRTRAAVYARDHHLCRVCLEQHRIVTENLQAHHIIPLEESDAYAYDTAWIITLCSGNKSSCHERAERGELSRAYLHELAASVLTGL